MKLTDNWFTAISQDENEKLITVTGREDLKEFVRSGKFKERAEIYWKFDGDAQGMPKDKLAEQMEEVELALRKAMEKDKLAIMTAIYTGGNQKTWVFYCRAVRVFGERLNEALAGFPQLPIEIYTEVDPDWEEYLDMLEMKEWEE
ncbi:MAG: DUF695 domain-containing protein [Bacteroidales bacterium]